MTTIDSCRRDVIRLDNPSSNLPKFIEWNVDMNVNVPSSGASKLTLRLRWITAFISCIAISLFLWQIKNQVEELRFKVYDINKNYESLQWRHKNLNTKLINLFNTVEKMRNTKLHCNCFQNSNEKTNAHLISEIVSHTEQNINEDEIKREIKNRSLENIEMERNGKITRTRRSLMFQTPRRNITTITRLETNVQGDEIDSYRSARLRRDEGRGKKRTKMNRRPKRSRGRLVPLMATFLGAVPEQHVIDSAHIGPWVKSIKDESKYSFNKFHLVDDRKAIEVTVDGLYMITAQIYYFGEYTHHSYWILLNAEGASVSQKLVKCAAASAISDGEVSCYTSVVLMLNRGDRIYVQQQERNRGDSPTVGHLFNVSTMF